MIDGEKRLLKDLTNKFGEDDKEIYYNPMNGRVKFKKRSNSNEWMN